MSRYVFRALNSEDIERMKASSEKSSILAKNPDERKYTIRNFIKNGRLRTRFIAMTENIGVADIKYGSLYKTEPRKRDSIIVMVDLDKLDENRLHYSPAAECDQESTARDMAIYGTEADNEIIYEVELPASSYEEVQPLLVDIMTGYEKKSFKRGREEATDKICSLIAEGKTEAILNKLFKNVFLNPIEKAFVENYYGIIFETDGSVKINLAKEQPLTGDMDSVEKYLEEEFHIKPRNVKFDLGVIGRCIQTGVISKLNYTEAEIEPLTDYSSPKREMISTRNMSDGRYHKNHLPLTDEKRDRTGTNGRALGGCLYYTDPQKTTLSERITLPYSIKYETNPEGYVAIHIYTKSLGYDEREQAYRNRSNGFGRDYINETIYLGSFERTPEIPAKEVLMVALGNKALTAREIEEKKRAEQKVKQELAKREEVLQNLNKAREKGELTPELLEEYLRNIFGNKGFKLLSVDDPKGRREVHLMQDENFEKFVSETIFDTPLNFRTKTGKTPVQTVTISKVPARKCTRKDAKGNIFEYYIPDDDNLAKMTRESPSPYFYNFEISGKSSSRILIFSDIDFLKAMLGRFMVKPEKSR